MTERSRLAMPEVAIGYFPDVGGSYFLPRIPGELGIYLGVTGVQIRAADALYCGLADWCLDSARLAELDQKLDHLQWQDSPLKDLQGLLAKLAVQQLPDAPLAALRPAIDHFFAQPDVPSIVEQLQQVTVADSHEWAVTTAQLMQTRSPLAMAVTLQMLRRGRHLALEDCFALELPGPPVVCPWRPDRRRACAVDRQGQIPALEPANVSGTGPEPRRQLLPRLRKEREITHARY